jgi:hypothetical protein
MIFEKIKYLSDKRKFVAKKAVVSILGVYTFYLLPQEQCTLITVFSTICAVYAYYLLLHEQYTLTKHKISGDFLSYTVHTQTICYCMSPPCCMCTLCNIHRIPVPIREVTYQTLHGRE